MIRVTPYYKTIEDLEHAEEPYTTVAKIIDTMYLTGPDGKNALHKSFKFPIAVSCIRTIAEQLSSHKVSFVRILQDEWTNLFNVNKQFTNDFDGYSLPYDNYGGTIFGGVYYVIAKSKSVEKDRLDTLESFMSKHNNAFPYFNVFLQTLKNEEPAKITGSAIHIITPETKSFADAHAAIAAEVSALKKELEEKDKLICELQAKANAEAEDGYSDDLEEVKEGDDVLYNKVSFELFLRLLEQTGLDVNNTGNKKRAGKLWHMMTGKSADEMRRYCSTRNYENNHTKKDIEWLNAHLSDMDITSIKL